MRMRSVCNLGFLVRQPVIPLCVLYVIWRIVCTSLYSVQDDSNNTAPSAIATATATATAVAATMVSAAATTPTHHTTYTYIHLLIYIYIQFDKRETYGTQGETFRVRQDVSERTSERASIYIMCVCFEQRTKHMLLYYVCNINANKN